jgi:Tol biopolymer transport system component
MVGLDEVDRLEGVAMRSAILAAVLGFLGLMVVSAAFAVAGDYGSWTTATRVEAQPGTDPSFNGPALDGCPFISRDGKRFYMARGPQYGGNGGIDIWVSTREKTDDPWGAPVNVGPPVNSSSNDFCPTISRDGHLFYFVSSRPGGCGGDDIYTTRLRAGGWDPVANLGCAADGGPNSAGLEASPFPLPERGAGPVLYFSSTRAGTMDIYRSEGHGGSFGLAEAVSELNTSAQDGHPNLRRDGLEIFFFSNRTGAQGNDIYSATRTSTSDAWSTPVNLGPNVNSAAAETRPSLSWDGTTLYFGSTRTGGGAEGDSDHYVTVRDNLTGSHE